jgi:hypothetical protein
MADRQKRPPVVVFIVILVIGLIGLLEDATMAKKRRLVQRRLSWRPRSSCVRLNDWQR